MAGIVLIFAAELAHEEIPTYLYITIEQVAGIAIATGILSLFWELAARRAFASEVLAAANLADDVHESGLRHIGVRYLSDDIWADKFSQASKLAIFVAYANTWREAHRGQLQAFAAAKDREILLIIPDVEHKDTVSAIALRSGKRHEDVIRKIVEARAKYIDLFSSGNGCRILAHQGPQAYAIYRFDRECVVTWYRNVPDKSANVPTMILSEGTFANAVNNDLDLVIERARQVWPEVES